MAIYYTLDGKFREVSPVNGKYFTYEELQNFVKDGDNTMIEIVPLPSGKSIVVNEEGKLIGLEINKLATEFWKIEYPLSKYPENNDELIVGNALVVEASELESEE